MTADHHPGRDDRGTASPVTQRATVFVETHRDRADRLGASLVEWIDEPHGFAAALGAGLAGIADPVYRDGQHLVAPGIRHTLGVRAPLLRTVARAFRQHSRDARAGELLQLADRLLREEALELRWFAFGLLDRTVATDPEQSWQLIRRAARDAGDWITVDTLATVVGHGILAEPYRWAELEQLVYSPSRWERRLVGSAIACIPYLDRAAGRSPAIARRAIEILGQLLGDDAADVRKALAWAYRSLSIVDPQAVAGALREEAQIAAATGDGHRAWVIRDSVLRLAPAEATAIRALVAGIRTRPGSPATSRAAETAARFADLGLGRPMPEPPLI